MATVGIVVKSEHEAWIATPMTGHPSALHKTRRETAKLLAPEVAVTTLTSLTRTAPSAFVTSLESPSADILTIRSSFSRMQSRAAAANATGAMPQRGGAFCDEGSRASTASITTTTTTHAIQLLRRDPTSNCTFTEVIVGTRVVGPASVTQCKPNKAVTKAFNTNNNLNKHLHRQQPKPKYPPTLYSSESEETGESGESEGSGESGESGDYGKSGQFIESKGVGGRGVSLLNIFTPVGATG